MRRLLVAIPILALAVSSSTACATKKFVRTSVGEVNDKVDSLGKSLEETQERTRRNEGRITGVDSKADRAQQTATQAGTAAQQANSAAQQANSAALAAGSKADAIEKASKRLVYEVVLSEDEGNFKFGQDRSAGRGQVQARSDDHGDQRLIPRARNFEIEGHTDNVGDPKTNERIGLERAESVKQYLYEQHQIPLHRMNVITYGEDKPIAENKTRDGRAQNRRVVIKVLA